MIEFKSRGDNEMFEIERCCTCRFRTGGFCDAWKDGIVLVQKDARGACDERTGEAVLAAVGESYALNRGRARVPVKTTMQLSE